MSYKDEELNEITVDDLEDVSGGKESIKPKQFKCTKCDMVFKTKDSLERHKYLVHTKNKSDGGTITIA